MLFAGPLAACVFRSLLYLFPHALLFLFWFFFLSAVPFFLLTRNYVYLGPPPGAAASESPPPGLRSFAPFRLKIAPWTDFSDFFKFLKGTQFQHRFRFAFFLTRPILAPHWSQDRLSGQNVSTKNGPKVEYPEVRGASWNRSGHHLLLKTLRGPICLICCRF